MIWSFEQLLALGIVGFYLIDSAMLLCFNELVFVKRRNGWGIVGGQQGLQVLGRSLLVPNPITPAQPLFRTCWVLSPAGDAAGSDPVAGGKADFGQLQLQRYLDALRPVRYVTMLLLVLLLGALPAVLLAIGAGTEFALLLAAVYLGIGVMLVTIYLSRGELGLPGKAFAKLAFDSLACPPLALNAVRRISLRRFFLAESLVFGRQVLDAQGYAQLIGLVGRILDGQIALEDDGSPRHKQLASYKRAIEEQVA